MKEYGLFSHRLMHMELRAGLVYKRPDTEDQHSDLCCIAAQQGIGLLSKTLPLGFRAYVVCSMLTQLAGSTKQAHLPLCCRTAYIGVLILSI